MQQKGGDTLQQKTSSRAILKEILSITFFKFVQQKILQATYTPKDTSKKWKSFDYSNFRIWHSA